jgi:hypothetical protein
VKEEHYIRTGIYLAYPTSPETKSIYRQKSYKTLDNDTHTKVGIAKDSFKAREKDMQQTLIIRSNFYL